MEEQSSGPMGSLAAALAAAQGEIAGAKKDSINPQFKSKYASLASIWDACRGPLSRHGLAIVQTTELSGDGVLILITRLVHKDGGEYVSRYPIVPQQNTPQGYGSGMTYARKYSVAAIAGVAPDDDDDGEAAEGRIHPGDPGPAGSAYRGDPTTDYARVPSEADITSASALGKELERLRKTKAGAKALLTELNPSLTTLKDLAPDQVRGLWEALMDHPIYGRSEHSQVAKDVEEIFGKA